MVSRMCRSQKCTDFLNVVDAKEYQQRDDQCLIAHNLLANEDIVKSLDQNELESIDSGILGSNDLNLVDLTKHLHELDKLFQDVTSWSRLSSACCAVVLNQDEASPEEEKFREEKTQELCAKAEELKARLQAAVPTLAHVTQNCVHSEHFRDAASLIDKFLAFTKDVDDKKKELQIQPTLLQDVHVLGNQLEKLLHSNDDNRTESSGLELSVNGDRLQPSPFKEENIFEQLAAIDMWAEEKLNDFNDPASYGGLPETAQSVLNKHLGFLEDIENKKKELSEILAANQIENPLLEAKLNRLLNSANERKENLENILKEAQKFNDDLQAFMDWLDGAERAMKSAQKTPVSIITKKIEDLMEEHGKFEDVLKEKRLELLELDKLGSQLKYFAQKQDGILIKNLLLSVHSRWDKLLTSVKAYSATINDIHKKSKQVKNINREESLLNQFWTASSELLTWINSAMNKLESNIPHHIEDDQVAESEIRIYEEFQTALASKQPVYNAVAKSGASLRDKAAIQNEKHEIDYVLNELKQQWNALKQKSQQRKTELEESLAFSERFYEEVNALLEWLFMIEPSLSKDVNVHGDIHTVDGLIKKHEVLKAEMESRRNKVDALQDSLRNEQGENWKSDNLQELLSQWDAVSELADYRQAELDSAEKLAKDLNESTEKLLAHLTKIDDDMYAHTKLPQDDFQLQELKVAHQATMADLQEKQAEFDRIVQLADYILDRAHPDAVIPVRQMVKLLQAKWFEVKVKANDHSSALDTKIAELEDDQQKIDKLKKWLATAEQKLRAQNQHPIKPEDVESQTNDLQAFQDEMAAKQPDYDKLIGRYTSRKSQTLMKKSPRGKTSKTDEPENSLKQQCEKLQSQWNNVWLLTMDRQKKLQEAKTVPKETKPDFDFDGWRKKFMKWLRQRKVKPMDFFRAMDQDGDGTISREEFMDGILKSSFHTKQSDVEKVCQFFEQENDSSVDYYKLVGALYPANEMSKLAKEADQIENEVVRQVSKCTCCKRFGVHQIAENKFRFGDNQQLRLVRILKSTVMVRVGGGWMALDEFLIKNDPCRAKRRTNTELREKFLLPAGASQVMSPFRTSRASKDKSPRKTK